MRYGGAFRFLAALLLIGVVGTLMALSYGAGAASQGAAAATGGRHFVGFLIGGFLVVLFLMLIFGAIGAGHRGHRYGSWSRFGPPGPDDWHGRSHWHGDDWPEGPKAALNEWHRQAHAGQGSTTGDASAATGPTPRAQA